MGGHDFALVWVSEDDDPDLWGEVKMDRREIRLSAKCLRLNQATETLVHEMIHVALGLSGQDELMSEQQEEALVRAMDYLLVPALIQLLKND